MFKKTEYTYLSRQESDYEDLSFKDNFDREAYEAKYKIYHDHVPYLIIVLIAIAIFFFAVWGVGAFPYVGAFLPNTTINGIDVSDMMTFQASNALKESLSDDYVFTVIINDEEYYLRASDLRLSFSFGTQIKDLASEQNGWLWPIANSQSFEYEVEPQIEFDRANIYTEVCQLEGAGTLYDRDEATDLICGAIVAGDTVINLDEMIVYEED